MSNMPGHALTLSVASGHLSDALQAIRQIATRGRGRKRATLFRVQLDDFIDDAAEVPEDGLFIVAMTAAEHEARSAADISPISFRPLDDFRVSVA